MNSGICGLCGCDLVKTGATTAEIHRGRCNACKPRNGGATKVADSRYCARCDVRLRQPADIARGTCASCHIIVAVATEDITVHGPDGPVRISRAQHARATKALEDSRKIIAAAASVPLTNTGAVVQTQRCASCGLRLVQSGAISAGLCVTCAAQQASATRDDDIPTDDSTCACGTPIKTGTIACSLCAGVTAIRELEDALYISRDQGQDAWRISRRGTVLVITSEEYRSSRHGKLEALKRWHAKIDAIEAAIPETPLNKSPWPRCPVHNVEGRSWLHTLAAIRKVEVPFDYQWPCFCQW